MDPGQPLKGEKTTPAQPAQPPAGSRPATRPLVLKPSLPLMVAYVALHVLLFLAVIAAAVIMVKTLFVPDLFSLYKEVVTNLRGVSGAAGDLMLLLLGNLWQTVMLAFVQLLALALVLQIPLLNLRWRLLPDALEYRKGFILTRKERLSYTDIADVSFERHVTGVDFGKIVVEYSGSEGRWLELPYIWRASLLTAELNSLVKAAKEREFGSQQQSQQPAQQQKAGQ